MQLRRRFRRTTTLEERLAAEARRLREEAELLQHGPVSDDALRRARQAEAGVRINNWLTSPGLNPRNRTKAARWRSWRTSLSSTLFGCRL
nr:hypothetical protein [Bradyrhizobium sp. MOS003]